LLTRQVLLGFLLTFSPQTGLDYIGRDFQDSLADPLGLIYNPKASVIAHCAEMFKSSGTSTWHRPTVEWLMVYVLTEAAVTPHTIRDGYGSMTVLNAYHEQALELVSNPQITSHFFLLYPVSDLSVENPSKASMAARRERQARPEIPRQLG